MHLLELEANWEIYEIIFSSEKRIDLKDIVKKLARESIYNGAVAFILHSGKKIYLRPIQDGDKWLTQKLILSSGGGRKWKTIGEFRKFDEIKVKREMEKRKLARVK